MFPYIFLIGLAALFMAILNSLGHFLTPALSPTVLNVAIIFAALVIAPGASNPALPLAMAVLVGGAGQLLIQVPAAVARGWRLRLRVAPNDPRVQEIARLMAPGVGGLAITQINVFVGTFLASFLVQGSVAALTYAFRLVQFPIGVIGVAIGTGALPVMAASFAKDAVGDMKAALQGSMRLAIFLTIPAMVGLLVFALPIMHVLFERGEFTREATILTAGVLQAYTLGLLFYVSNRILAPAFYAMHDTWTPMRSGMLALGVNITASILLMQRLGVAGLALATAAASLTNFLLLFTHLRRRIGLLGMRRLMASAAKVGLACIPMAGWGLVSQGWWDVLATSGTAAKVALFCGQLGVAVGLYAATAAVLRCEEFRWVLDLLRHRGSEAMRGGVTR
jgi:putative peptidoglycan lipid II flippase